MLNNKEDQIRRNADIKQWLEGKISELEIELDNFKHNLTLVDEVLRKQSFQDATTFESTSKSNSPSEDKNGNESSISSTSKSNNEKSDDLYQIRSGTNELIANAYLLPNEISIVPVSDSKLNVNTPPFQSFFINRILDEFKKNDSEKEFNYDISESNEIIEKITIYNYKTQHTLDEILKTATWSFSKMIENKEKN